MLNEGLFGGEKHKSFLPAINFIYLLFFLPAIFIVAGLFLLTFFLSITGAGGGDWQLECWE